MSRHGWHTLAALAALAAAVVAAAALPAVSSGQLVPGPSTSFDSGPQDPTPTNDPTPTFAFSSLDLLATFECELDAGALGACSSPYTSDPLADGPHSLSVRAVDALANPGDWATRTFTVDTVAPGAPSVSGPSGPINDPTPTFTFSSDEPGVTLECALDAGGFASCDSPHTTAALSEGTHQFSVRASDAAGNQSPAVTRTFTVDSGVPAVTFTAGPDGPTREQRPTFTFTSSSPGSTFQCRLDTAPVPCSTGSFTPATNLADGAHLFEARATSSAGTAGSYEPRQFSVDTVGPETVIVTGPAAQTTERSPSVAFEGSEPNVSFECSVDGGAFTTCTSPWTPGQLALGPHRVAVRALDALGNPDPSPAVAEFTVADPPVAVPSAQPTVDARLRLLAGDLVLNLDRVAGRLRTTETPAILRTGGVSVPGMTALMPGTLTVTASAPSPGSSKTVLRGSTTFPAEGSGPVLLKVTRSGRDTLSRFATVPVILGAQFSTPGLSLSANREATLVRDYLTAAEARRAVARALARREDAPVRHREVEVRRRCGSGCLNVAAWWRAGGIPRVALGRARQVDGRLSARLRIPVSASR